MRRIFNLSTLVGLGLRIDFLFKRVLVFRGLLPPSSSPEHRYLHDLLVFVLSILVIRLLAPRPIPQISLSLTTASLAIAVPWAAQHLNPTVIHNRIVGTEDMKPYEILALFFSLAYGATGHNGLKLYFCFYVTLSLVSIFLRNDPVILPRAEFWVCYTKIAKLYKTGVMAEFAAASMASAVLFVANPMNVVCISHIK